MTAFIRANFQIHNGWIRYDNKFVARFRTAGATGFASFLVKNFSVEEYFDRLEGNDEAPLKIAESKGYILPHIKKWLKRDGYPVTRAGYEAYLDARIASYKAAHQG